MRPNTPTPSQTQNPIDASAATQASDPAVTPQPVEVPEGFPRDPFPAALPGSQIKVSARLIDGRYVVGLTPEERQGRYLMCADLVEQLVGYCLRKREQQPDRTVAQLLENINQRIRLQGWELGAEEYDWIMGRLAVRMGSGE